MLFRYLLRRIALLSALLLCFVPSSQAQTKKKTSTGDLMNSRGRFERGSTVANKWGGVDRNNKLRTVPRRAQVVLTDGKVLDLNYPSSVGAGDLNNDKKLDLIVADATGYFWYYPNIGSEKEPKFDHGQIIPLWVTPRGNTNSIRAVNKIHLTDYNEDGRLDLVIGNYIGQIYLIPNTGTASVPKFRTPSNLKAAAVPTAAKGKLWGNFFSPHYIDWNGDNRRDLLIGDGTYATNNIYLLPNSGTNANPQFKPEERTKLINGFGREHLTPYAIDWNEDGKMDVMTGEREGAITVFLNKSGDLKNPEFEATDVKFGASRRLGTLSSAVPADMNGDGLFDLLTTRTSGHIGLTLNTGKKGAPKFDRPKDLVGATPYPKMKRPSNWTARLDEQNTFWLFRLVGTNESDATTYEAGLKLAPGSKYAAKYERVTPVGPLFNKAIAPPPEPIVNINYDTPIKLKPKTKYELKYRIKGAGFSSAKVSFRAYERLGKKNFTIGNAKSIRVPGNWSQESWVFSYRRPKAFKDQDQVANLRLSFEFMGLGDNVYLDDITLTEKK